MDGPDCRSERATGRRSTRGYRPAGRGRPGRINNIHFHRPFSGRMAVPTPTNKFEMEKHVGYGLRLAARWDDIWILALVVVVVVVSSLKKRGSSSLRIDPFMIAAAWKNAISIENRSGGGIDACDWLQLPWGTETTLE
ncbi:hypothetical protein QR685DRAFT_545305 [Neurospora intermedia]|uniref:Uncharacterized protein n=1 Tax=Neurospora intermedia TaxID=5142 RepID=A0ABR3DDG8_NEUIN